MSYPRVSRLKTVGQFSTRLKELGIGIPFDETIDKSTALARNIEWNGRIIGNRFSILPMEGWDGTPDGKPSELTRRRWKNFGISGAKLIWGGEAVAVRQDGRANPNQLLINDENLADLESLRQLLVTSHQERFQKTDDLIVGLQLTHSGRFARPNDKSNLEARTLYSHKLLDRKFDIDPQKAILSDDELKQLIELLPRDRLLDRARTCQQRCVS